MADVLSRLWRVAGSWRGDAALAAGLAVCPLSVEIAAGTVRGGRGLLPVICAVGICGCLVARRAHPQLAAAAAAVLFCGERSVNGAFVPDLTVALFMLAYSLGEPQRPRRSVLVLLLLIAGVQFAVGLDPSGVMVTAGPWAAGLVARSRGRLAEQLAVRGRELEAERELFTAESVRYERARIARELHDIVAHCVSVMVIQASAGKRLTTTDPARAAEAFEAIGEAARQAKAEIGYLAGLLDRDPPSAGGGIRLLDELIARASAAGLAVSYQAAGSFDGLSAAACETAYRVIQESLTNALKHAPGVPVAITIRGADGHVEINVANGHPAAPSGLERAGGGRGLAGMRERVALCGGYLTVGPAAGGGWTVHARLPGQASPVREGRAG